MYSIEEILKDDYKLTEVTKTVFAAIDTDHSGHIDKQEFKIAMITVAHEAGITPPTYEQITEALYTIDTDKSGTVDVFEFKELIRQLLEANI
jgi:Ca2+-binding EF-hand superfamily protein